MDGSTCSSMAPVLTLATATVDEGVTSSMLQEVASGVV